jgi:hypothetical protein
MAIINLTLERKILEQLGEDFDITNCRICDARIVVMDAEMEYPHCNREECVSEFLSIE